MTMENIEQPKIASYFMYIKYFFKTDSFTQAPHTSVDEPSAHLSTPWFLIIRIMEVSTKFLFSLIPIKYLLYRMG